MKYGPLEVIEAGQLADTCPEPWWNQTLCRVNDCVVRLGVFEGEFAPLPSLAAVSGQSLVFLSGGFTIMGMELGTNWLHEIASDVELGRFVVDGTYVYWGDAGQEALLRLRAHQQEGPLRARENTGSRGRVDCGCVHAAADHHHRVVQDAKSLHFVAGDRLLKLAK